MIYAALYGKILKIASLHLSFEDQKSKHIYYT